MDSEVLSTVENNKNEKKLFNTPKNNKNEEKKGMFKGLNLIKVENNPKKS